MEKLQNSKLRVNHSPKEFGTMGMIFMKETEVWFIIYTSECVSRA